MLSVSRQTINKIGLLSNNISSCLQKHISESLKTYIQCLLHKYLKTVLSFRCYLVDMFLYIYFILHFRVFVKFTMHCNPFVDVLVRHINVYLFDIFKLSCIFCHVYGTMYVNTLICKCNDMLVIN